MYNGKPTGKKTKRKEKANHIGESEEESNTGDSIGRVSKDFWALEVSPKSKMAELQLTALDWGNRSKQIKSDLLIDSGVYRTVLTEEQWRQIQPEGANRMPELKKTAVRLVPYGTKKTLEMLGRSR